MAFDKTSAPYWFMEDTPVNICDELAKEKIRQQEILCFAYAETTGKFAIIVRKGL